MHRFQPSAAAVSLALMTVAVATADVITTVDGSRLVGTVEQIAGGKLVIQTEIAGRLEIDASKVVSVSTDRPVNVAVSSGDKLVGLMDSSPDGTTSVVRSELGDISIAPSNITLLWPEGTESPEIIAIRAKAQAEIEAAKPKWSATLEAGAAGTDGNTDTLEGHGRFDLKRTTEHDRLHFYLAARYSEQDDKRSKNEYLGGIRLEITSTRRWYWYARTEFEFDEFEGIDLRATAAAGAGYYWLKRPDHELKTSFGVGYRHESYDIERSSDAAILDLGLDYRLEISPWIQFTHSTLYSPDFLEFADYRLRLDTALLIPFKDERWAWKIGMKNQYNSRPQSGLDRLDNTYYTSIVLSLK